MRGRGDDIFQSRGGGRSRYGRGQGEPHKPISKGKNDYSNDEFELQTPDMITPYSYPTEDEFVHHEIANNFD